MLEKDIESWAKRKAREAGWYVRKFTSPGNRSVPDDIFLKGGHVFWVEFKATGKQPTGLQEEEHKALRDHGGTVHVCDSRELFAEILVNEESYLVLQDFIGKPQDFP